MEKLKNILLFIVNLFIDVFLACIVICLLLWLIWGITPDKVVQTSAAWIEQTWNSLTGHVSKERTRLMSDDFRRKAHRNIYVHEPSKYNEEGRITQPYKHELDPDER